MLACASTMAVDCLNAPVSPVVRSPAKGGDPHVVKPYRLLIAIAAGPTPRGDDAGAAARVRPRRWFRHSVTFHSPASDPQPPPSALIKWMLAAICKLMSWANVN